MQYAREVYTLMVEDNLSLQTLFAKVVGAFTSDKAKSAFHKMSDILPMALIIVKLINQGAPNKTVEQITGLFEKYGIPFVDHYAENPGEALLKLGTTLVADKVPPGTPKSIIQAAIQLAVVAEHSDNK